MKQVVRAFANPRYVFDSSSVPGALVSVYDVRDREGKPVMASLVSAAKANRIEVNLVTSIYGKTEKRLQEWVDEGLLRYVDDTEKPEGILRLNCRQRALRLLPQTYYANHGLSTKRHRRRSLPIP